MTDISFTGLATWLAQWFTKTSDLGAVALSNDYDDLDNKPNIPSGSVVDTALDSSSGNPVANSVITSELDSLNGSITNKIYPIGSIYMSVNSTNPSELFGGTWERIQDRFLLASGSTYSNGSTGGSADAVVVSHTHTQTQHRHGLGSDWSSGTGSSGAYMHSSNRGRTTKYSDYQTPTIQSSGEDGTGKNMPPYLAVYVWKRTA